MLEQAPKGLFSDWTVNLVLPLKEQFYGTMYSI
jgi:hypothetical protein